MNISLSFTILGPAPRSHLPAEEENHPNEEGAAHNQWRSQGGQVLEHAGLLSRPSSACSSPYLALSPTHPTASNPGLPARPMASYHGSAP
jgi:hypothetical protein